MSPHTKRINAINRLTRIAAHGPLSDGKLPLNNFMQYINGPDTNGSKLMRRDCRRLGLSPAKVIARAKRGTPLALQPATYEPAFE